MALKISTRFTTFFYVIKITFIGIDDWKLFKTLYLALHPKKITNNVFIIQLVYSNLFSHSFN